MTVEQTANFLITANSPLMTLAEEIGNGSVGDRVDLEARLYYLCAGMVVMSTAPEWARAAMALSGVSGPVLVRQVGVIERWLAEHPIVSEAP